MLNECFQCYSIVLTAKDIILQSRAVIRRQRIVASDIPLACARNREINGKFSGVFLLPVENPVTATPTSLSFVVALWDPNFSARTDYRSYCRFIDTVKITSGDRHANKIPRSPLPCSNDEFSMSYARSNTIREDSTSRFTQEMYA